MSVKRESTELIVLHCSTGIRFSFLIVSPYYSSLPEFVFNLHFLMISATVFENFEKKTEKQQQSMSIVTKLSLAILSILGDCLEKFICSSLPSRLMEEFLASKEYLQPAT